MERTTDSDRSTQRNGTITYSAKPDRTPDGGDFPESLSSGKSLRAQNKFFFCSHIRTITITLAESDIASKIKQTNENRNTYSLRINTIHTATSLLSTGVGVILRTRCWYTEVGNSVGNPKKSRIYAQKQAAHEQRRTNSSPRLHIDDLCRRLWFRIAPTWTSTFR